jgi:hypothetical protein
MRHSQFNNPQPVCIAIVRAKVRLIVNIVMPFVTVAIHVFLVVNIHGLSLSHILRTSDVEPSSVIRNIVALHRFKCRLPFCSYVTMPLVLQPQCNAKPLPSHITECHASVPFL